MESVVVAVDDAACTSDIEEVAPKITSRLESMSEQSISKTIDEKKVSDLNEDKIEVAPLHNAGDNIKSSRNKLLNSSNDTVANADIHSDDDPDRGCYNQSFSKSESVTSVKVDVNHVNENLSDDASLASSGIRNSGAKPNDPDGKEKL